MDFNPILTEIQGHFAAMSPEAQGAVKMAGMTPPGPTIEPSASGKIAPGMLLPHPDSGPPPGPISMGSQTPSLSMPSAAPQLVTGPNRGQAIMSSGETPSPLLKSQAEVSRLRDEGTGVDQIYHNITNSGFGQNHPLLGKILGGVAQTAGKIGDVGLSLAAPALAAQVPGTTFHHQELLGRANNALHQDVGNAQKEAQTASEDATAGKTNAEIPEVAPEAEARIGVQKAQADEMAGANATKESVADKNVEGRESVAQTGANSREQIAQTAAQSREAVAQTAAEARKSAEDAQDRTREAVARIRGAGTGKGAAGGPTNNSKARGEMSETMLAQAPGILQEIDSLNTKIGPGAGRWNNFWVKKGGANDPDYAALDQDLSLYASALAVAHFGARGGGAHFIDAMKKDFSQAQSPEDLKARILHADKWLEGYEQEGKGDKPSNTSQSGNADIIVDPKDLH
jgi:hypothetical protein